jgi:hypothetical protein
MLQKSVLGSEVDCMCNKSRTLPLNGFRNMPLLPVSCLRATGTANSLLLKRMFYGQIPDANPSSLDSVF